MIPHAPLLAIDPGRDKCGLAVVDGTGALLHREVIPTVQLTHRLALLLERFAPARVLMGNGTSWRKLRPVVEEVILVHRSRLSRGATDSDLALEVVNERYTTERAREAYWKHNPPRGLRRLVPLGLQVPPEPYDDYAAWCMAVDYISQLSSGTAAND